MKILNHIRTNPLLWLGLIMLIALVYMTFFGKYLPQVDQKLHTILYVMDENKKPVIPPYPPSEEHLLGTDNTGRDLLSLLVLGAKETLGIIALITLIRYLIAIPLAFFAHKNILGSRIILHWLNGFLSYIPTIVVVILLVTLPPILTTEIRPVYILLIIAFVEIGRAADMIKLEFDELSSKEFIKAGIACGASPLTMFKTYYLPFLYGKIAVYMISDLGRVLFLLGQLGFIGIFISQELVQQENGLSKLVNNSISWPAMFIDAFNDVRGPIWIPFFAALAMTYTIFTFNLLAQGLQNLLKKKVRYI
ncbi:ABC transporter permease [Peribacillus alkalitolerans]|uniref:ABC transporter permease n=1 Tax=Peribacillus alkalitolerans TaxID=1550385 RepID=UPI0013D413F4|nr:ABC transporter permease subunit [Peribacillus alkalitolerans]